MLFKFFRQIFLLALLLLSLVIEESCAEITVYPQDFTARALYLVPSYEFRIEPPGEKGLDYRTNTVGKPGVGLSYKGLGGNIRWTYRGDAADRLKKGETASTDYTFGIYWSSFAIDLFYQRYKGFYLDGTADENGYFVTVPDAKAIHYGVVGYYIFSPETYTMASAFDQTLKQTESGGSWVASVFAQTFTIDTGSKITGDPTRVNSTLLYLKAKSDNLGASAGYGYRWNFAQEWYLSFQLLVGIGYQMRHFEESGQNSRTSGGVGVKSTAHLGIGWNIEQHSIALRALADALRVPDIRGTISSSAVQGELFYAYRFSI